MSCLETGQSLQGSVDRRAAAHAVSTFHMLPSLGSAGPWTSTCQTSPASSSLICWHAFPLLAGQRCRGIPNQTRCTPSAQAVAATLLQHLCPGWW